MAHAERHGIKPIADPDTMRADFWPAEESVDDFVAAVRELRRRGREDIQAALALAGQ